MVKRNHYPADVGDNNLRTTIPSMEELLGFVKICLTLNIGKILR
jgi:hypothetical protein